MTIMLHGATNYGSSNYGDFIYAEEIYNLITGSYNEACFYEASPFFQKHINCESNKDKKFDALVYIPGGYFIQDSTSFKSVIFRIIRYFPIGFKAIIQKKPILILGLGIGPIKSKALQFCLRRIIKATSFITVRDQISVETVQKISGVNVTNYGDMILSFDVAAKQRRTQQIDKIISNSQNKKIVLLHYNHDIDALRLYSEYINTVSDKDYYFVVASDCILENEDDLFKLFCERSSVDVDHFIYSDPYEFTELLNTIDILITCKLHAGVIAAVFGKSVVCTAAHYDKTIRFYEQINRRDCISNLKETDKELLSEMVESATNKPIRIQDELIAKSKKHGEVLEQFMELVSRNA